jgi:hypothetical protein
MSDSCRSGVTIDWTDVRGDEMLEGMWTSFPALRGTGGDAVLR